MLNSFVSLYYYLMVLRQVYLFDPEDGIKRFRINPLLQAMGVALLLGVVFIGVWPRPLFEAADHATAPLFQVGASDSGR